MFPRWNHKFEVKPGRWVFVPDEQTRQIGQSIKQAIESVWQAPDYYAHLHTGGHIRAIKRHTTDRTFLRADICHFFNCISTNRIIRNLKDMGFSYEDAKRMGRESTVRNPQNHEEYVLPYGFIQSPIIASLCLFKSALGSFLDGLTKDGCCVTVYMDDILISSQSSPVEMSSVFSELVEKAEKSKLPINQNKTFGPALHSEIFNITIGNEELKLSSNRMEQFKSQALESQTPASIDAILRYVGQINQEDHRNLIASLQSDE